MASLRAGVSFLICTYNGVERISETLACLARQKGASTIEWEVIFVDNASTDNTTSVAQVYWEKLGSPVPLRTFEEPRPGKNFAVEVAFSQASYGYVCIVDDDNRLASDYLQIGYDLLESNPKIGILGGQNTGVFEVMPPDWFSAYQALYAVGPQLRPYQSIPLPDGLVEEAVLWGAGMFVRMEVWYKLRQGEFKSLFLGRQGTKNLTAGEDDELCYASRLLGYEVWYSSNLKLQHYMTASRLTEAYRDRLFYGTVWSQARLKVYRDVLGNSSGKQLGSTTNLTKDILYMSRTVAQRLLSRGYVQALLNGDNKHLMSCHHQLLTLYDFIRNFREIQDYYKVVKAFKQRVSKSPVEQIA
ncbi:glycosyltransferase [Hymenobacter profundi]|uniref:Glycosyltransferase n=1 Tax=Hymenobacter profundi TaxID=1982110 RepID=A0ABS6WXX2_9BACT|nr:glycosyltransferase [Hymenobacter profundi]MBW3127589.1 glycosyltransferase [Hymenobacter profundi]